MTDIVARLRDPNRLAATKRDEEAADEIERLRAALQEIANPKKYVTMDGYPSKPAPQIAREALRHD